MLNHTLQRPVKKVYNEENWTIKVIKCKMHCDECQNVTIFDLNYTFLSVLCGTVNSLQTYLSLGCLALSSMVNDMDQNTPSHL